MLTLLTALINTLVPLHAETLQARVVLASTARFPVAIVEVETARTLRYAHCFVPRQKSPVAPGVLTYLTQSYCYSIGPEVDSSLSTRAALAARFDQELRGYAEAFQALTQPKLMSVGGATSAAVAAAYVGVGRRGGAIPIIAAAAAGGLGFYGMHRAVVPDFERAIRDIERIGAEFRIERSMIDYAAPEQSVSTNTLRIVERALALALSGVK